MEREFSEFAEEYVELWFEAVPNYKLVTPENKRKLKGLMDHYGKMSHPFTQCVADNTKRFGKGRSEKICAVLKDLIKGTTMWRSTERKKAMSVAEFPPYEQAFVDWLSEVDMAEFAGANWIQKAIKRPGQLHRDLGVPQGKKIPVGKVKAASKRKGKVGQRARLAMTLRKLRKRKTPAAAYAETGEEYLDDEDLVNLELVLGLIGDTDTADTADTADFTERAFLEKRSVRERLGFSEEMETVDIAGVSLLATGGPYFGQGSPKEGDFFTEADLQVIARANNELAEAAELQAPSKIGHNKAQQLAKVSGLDLDEMPRLGYLENYRVSGGKLLADIRRMPKRFASLVKAGAYPKRSVELGRVVSQKLGGREFPQAVTGLAWLGGKNPAVRTLDDIAALFSEEEGVTTVPGDTTARMPELTFTDEQREALAEKLGLSVEELTLDTLLAKLDPEPVTEEAGVVKMTEAEVEVLRANAEAGKVAHTKLADTERDTEIDVRIREGRIDPAKREFWQEQWGKDSELAKTLMSELPVNDEFLRVYGDGTDPLTGDGRQQGEDDYYKAYAAATGVDAGFEVED